MAEFQAIPGKLLYRELIFSGSARPAMAGNLSKKAPPRSSLFPIHQDDPDIIDIGERRTGQQEIAGRGEEGGGVVVVEIGLRIEAERRHLRESAVIDHGGGGISGAGG